MADAVDVADRSLSVMGAVILDAASTALFIAYPWLNIPPLSWLCEYILYRFESQIVLQLQKTSNAVIIFVSEEDNAKAANNAAAQLQAVQSDAKATDAEKQKAADDFKAAYQKLIGFRISSDELA